MRPLTTKVWKDFTTGKVRTLLVVLSIALGTLGLTATGIASAQIDRSLRQALQESAEPDLQFVTAPAPRWILADLRRQPNVADVQAEGFAATAWTLPAGHKPLDIIGVPDFQAVHLGKFELIAGRLPRSGELLMESSDRTLAPISVGDRVSVQVGTTIRHLLVSGLARTPGQSSASVDDRAVAYMPQSELVRLFRAPGISRFLVRLRDYGRREATGRLLGAMFSTHHVIVYSARVGHDDAPSRITSGLLGTLRVLSLIALLLGLLLILTTVSTLLAEQAPVIGAMRTMGATRARVVQGYLGLIVLYGVTGTAVGFLVGLLAADILARYLGSLFTLDVNQLSIPPGLVLLDFAIGIGAPLAVAVAPVYLGTRGPVHQLLSSHGMGSAPRRRTGRARGRIAGGTRATPQSILLGTRELRSRRLRSGLTLLALVISAAGLLAVQTASDSFSSLLQQANTAYRADVFVTLAQARPYGGVWRVVRPVQGAVRIERLAQMDVDTHWGVAALTGIDPSSRLYHRQIVSGRWLTNQSHGEVLISADAAERSGLRVGDTLNAHDSLHRARWRIIGIVRDYNGVAAGTNAFGVILASMAEVNAFAQLPPDFTSGLMIGSRRRSQPDVAALADRIDAALGAAGQQVTVWTARQQNDRIQGRLGVIEGLFYAVVVLVALLGAIGLASELAASVQERRREIGVLRSMGATSRKVVQMIMMEGISLGAAAWLLGLILGIPASYGFVRLLSRVLVPIPFSFAPAGVVTMLLFTLAVAALASLGPALGAARVDIPKALRYQ